MTTQQQASTRRGGSVTYIENAEGKMRVALSAAAKAVVSKKLVENSVPGKTSPLWNRGGACIEWTGTRGTEGQGVLTVVGQTMAASRAAYLSMVGPVELDEKGRPFDVYRLCQNKTCINTHHLEAVPHAVSIQREAALLTHCTNGHERNEENTRVRRNGGRTYRGCILCERACSQRYLAKKKAEQEAAAAA